MNVKRQSGNGAVMNLEMNEKDTLTLEKMTFSGCKCESGNGGAVYINIKNSEFKLVVESSVTFTNCEALICGGMYMEINGGSVDKKSVINNKGVFTGEKTSLF